MGAVTLMLRYQGELLGFAGATRFYLVPHIERLPDDHPLVRMATVMALFADQIKRGELDGPYSDERAELYARCALISDDEFTSVDAEGWSDEVIAEHFGVPAEQIAAKRDDLRT